MGSGLQECPDEVPQQWSVQKLLLFLTGIYLDIDTCEPEEFAGRLFLNFLTA